MALSPGVALKAVRDISNMPASGGPREFWMSSHTKSVLLLGTVTTLTTPLTYIYNYMSDTTHGVTDTHVTRHYRRTSWLLHSLLWGSFGSPHTHRSRAG